RASMLVAHSTRSAAATNSRRRSTTRQLADWDSLTEFLLCRRHNRRRRRFRRHDPLDDHRRARRGSHQMKALGGEGFNACRRLQRFNLELEMPVDFFFLGALLLHLLDAVPVLQKLDALPPGEQNHDHEQAADGQKPPLLAQPVLVHLAHDGVVAHVFLDRVFKGFGPSPFARVHHRTRSATRSLALRARGFRSISSGWGTTGFFVNTRMAAGSRAASARIVCFTMRSSSEWNVITTMRAPARSRLTAAAKN